MNYVKNVRPTLLLCCVMATLHTHFESGMHLNKLLINIHTYCMFRLKSI